MKCKEYKDGTKANFLIIVVTLLFLGLFCITFANAKEITDMFGKKVSIPDIPQKVYSTFPPLTCMLYAIDPSMIAGLNFPIKQKQKRYLRKSMQNLPVLGGWFGQANTPNIEMIIKTKPEIIVVSKYNAAMNSIVDATMRTIPIPVVNVPLNALSDYPEAISYLGRILGRESRAKELEAYALSTLTQMSSIAQAIPQNQRVSVYYAEGIDGLSTECDTSPHTELINLAGGRNVHCCAISSLYGMEKINIEQVMIYNPEVILVMEPAFYRTVFSDPRWSRIKAVQDKKVYLIPSQPFNWFDRPPSFMRFLGVKWLMSLLYPDRYQADMLKETQRFFSIFLSIDISTEEARKVIQSR